MDDDEVEKIVGEKLLDMEKKYQWKQCRYQDKDEYLLPDTTLALGHDVFRLDRFKVRDVDPELLVWAYPSRYSNSYSLADMFSKRMAFKDLPEDHRIRIGIIKNGKVFKWDETV
jgi:hypothetical protein